MLGHAFINYPVYLCSHLLPYMQEKAAQVLEEALR